MFPNRIQVIYISNENLEQQKIDIMKHIPKPGDYDLRPDLIREIEDIQKRNGWIRE